MGLLDDLAMGFGMKERTEDYDARTAKAIALDDRYGDDHIAQMRARQGYETTSYDPRATPIGKNDQGRMVYRYGYDTSTGPAARFLEGRGYDEGYIPSVGGTGPSATPYAIGPMSMDQPLPAFGLLGLFAKGLGGLFGPKDDTAGSINVAKNAMSQLSPRYETVTARPSGQPETVFTENLSNVDLATFPISMDFSDVEPLEPAARDAQEVQRITEETNSVINNAPPSGVIQLKRGPHAGKLFDTRTGRIVR